MSNQTDSANYPTQSVPDPEDHVLVQDYLLSDYAHGFGHDPLQRKERENPFDRGTLAPVDHGSPESEGKMVFARTFKELAEKMEIQLGLEYGYIIPDATVAGKLIESFTRSEETVRICGYFRQKIGLRDLTHSETRPRFLDEAEAMITKLEWDSFFESYGAYFCDGIITGGNLFVHTTIRASTIKGAKSLEATIDSDVGATNPVGFYGSLEKALDRNGESYSSTTGSFVTGAVIGEPEYNSENLGEAAKSLIDYINHFVGKIEDTPLPMAAEMRAYWDFDPRLVGLRDALTKARRHAYAFETLAANLFDIESRLVEVEVWINRKQLTESEENAAERANIKATLTDWGIALRNCYGRMRRLSDYKQPTDCPELQGLELDRLSSRIDNLRRSILDDHLVFGECFEVQFRKNERFFCEPSTSKPSALDLDQGSEGPDESKKHPYISLTEHADEAVAYQVLATVDKRNGTPVRIGDEIRFAYPEDGQTTDNAGDQIYMSKRFNACGLCEPIPKSRIQYRWVTREASYDATKQRGRAITLNEYLSLRNAHEAKWDMIAKGAVLEVSDDADDDNAMIFSRPIVPDDAPRF